MSDKYPRVGVGALIVEANKTLLQLRRRSPEANYWSIPGGRVEFLETIEAAVIREIREELGVDIEIIKLLTVTNHIVQDENQHWISPAFLVRIIQGTPTNQEPDKFDDVQWFDIDELPTAITLTTKSALHAYRKWLDSGQ